MVRAPSTSTARRQPLLVAAALIVLTAPALAEPAALARAHAAVDSSDYPSARPALAEALAAGTSSPAELADLYRLSGIVEAALGDPDAATDAFAHLLALQPDARLPDGTSPKLVRPFAAAAAKLGHHALHVQTSVDKGFAVIVDDDPLAMAAAVRISFNLDGTASSTESPITRRLDVPIPATSGRHLVIVAVVVDAHGNRLVELPASEIAPRRAPEPRRPLYARPWLYTIPAAVALAVGAGYGLAARSAVDDLDSTLADAPHHTFEQAKALDARARRDATRANLAFGVGGVFAVTAIVVLVVGHRADSFSASDSSVAYVGSF